MGKPNIDGNFAKKSNLDIHPSQLDEQTYRHAINSNMESRDGSSVMLTNEQSNILCSKFAGKESHRVINATVDINRNRTYFFLTNPTTGCSEIGYIQDTEEVNDLNDIEKKCGCDISNLLSAPLEDLEQIETCEYITLLCDCCPDCDNGGNPDSIGYQCLNFDIQYPISAEIKKEKCGDVIYFTDDLNDIRRLEIDNIGQYGYVERDCSDDPESPIYSENCDCGKVKEDACLDCEKLKLFRSFSNPCIEVNVISGGNLTHSSNVFYVAYADENGNELTRYSSITGEVPIKDPTKNIYTQPELDAITNLSIALKISNLDIRAPHYKIVVKQTSALDSAVSYFEVGTFPTTKNEVIFSTTKTLKRTTIEELVAELPKYNTAKTVESANNQLFISDLTSQPEVNLQPVVNLLGEFAKWRSFIAEEDIYNNPDYVEKYRTYMRNEVYPFAIRFGTNNYVTALFPLISRAIKDEDCDEEINIEQLLASEGPSPGLETDIYSVLKHGEVDCGDYLRTCKWQYYNTATVERECADEEEKGCSTIEFETEDREEERSYSVDLTCDDTINVTFDETDINLNDYEFTTVENFLEDFQEEVADELGETHCFYDYTYNTDPEDNCDDVAGAELFGLVPDPQNEGEYISDVDEDGCPISTCDDFTWSRSEILFRGLGIAPNEYLYLKYKTCDGYNPPKNLEVCSIYETGGATSDYTNLNSCCDDCGRTKCKKNKNKCDDEPCCDWEFVEMVDGSCHPKNPVFERGAPTLGGVNCDGAGVIPLDSPYPIPTHLVPHFSSDESGTNDVPLTNSTHTADVSTVASNIPNYLNRIRRRCRGNDIDSEPGTWASFIHTNAAWFTVNQIPSGGIVLSISDMVDCPSSNKKKDCLLYSDEFRYNLFNGCDTAAVFGGLIKDAGVACSNNPFVKETIGIISWASPPPIESEANQVYIVEDPTTLTSEEAPAEFQITRDSNGGVVSVLVTFSGFYNTNPGSIIINGSDIGGISGTDNLTINVLTTNSDQTSIDSNGHVIYLSENAIEALFPNGVVMAIDAPIYEFGPGCGSQYDDDALLSGVIVGITGQNTDNATCNASPCGPTQFSATGGSGSGAIFEVEYDGSSWTVTLVNGGQDYEVGEELVILLSGGGFADFITFKVDVITTIPNPIPPPPNTDTCGYVTGTCNCFTVTAQSPEITSVSIYTEAPQNFEKECYYTSTCEFRVYEDLKCDPQFWEQGEFAYWESTEEYPNNKELYDSSNLKIPFNIIDTLDEDVKTKFEDIFTVGLDETFNYVLNNQTTDFTCKPIRHFKFPDNKTSPYQDGSMTQGGILPFAKNKVFPLGFYLDNDIIDKFLDIAVENNLITQEFRNSIEYYEIFRGDTRLHKSILGKGILFDSWEYDEQTEPHQFANFPFNDNSTNKLLYKERTLREDYIEHPTDNSGNNKFFFHSPEFSFEKPAVPFEFEVEAYLLGQSKGYFSDVKDHPKMVVLGNRAYRVARTLGAIESTLELATDIIDRGLSTAESSFVGTSTNWGSAFAWAGFALYAAERVFSEATLGGRQKVNEWLTIFDNKGTPQNFASYYVAEGFYNKIGFPRNEGNKLRGISDGRYLKNGRYSYNVNTGELSDPSLNLKINQYNRVSSLFLYLGGFQTNINPFNLEVDQSYYKNYDNSRVINKNCILFDDENKSVTPEIQRNIQSPYVSLKRYLPAQYGGIDDINWISTNYCGFIRRNNECDAIFGGDSFISRFAFKRHFPFFISPMINENGALADFTPFSYTRERNVGVPRYYIDYLLNPSEDYGGGILLPRIESFFNLDCFSEKGLYVVPPSTFYLWHYGIPNFLVESRINLNYRYGSNNKEGDFFPNQSDIVEWTQERNVSSLHDNYYQYSYAYSSENEIYAWRILPSTYNKEEWDCRFDNKNRSIYSLSDANTQDTIDNWKVFRANNYNDFGEKYGDLIGLKNIESEKVIGRFENGMVVFNAFNTIQGSVENIQVGTGGIFATRPTEFYRSDLGYAGTQHQAWVSSEFGHFWVDAKRGRVHQVNPGGDGLQDISLMGWKNWFRENLPFNLKKQIPTIPNSFLDNAYNGPGIAMTWDDRYSRLFITKRDYKIKDDPECCIEYKEGVGLVNNLTKCGGPQIEVCPEGYEPDEETGKCKKVLEIPLEEEDNCEFDLVIVMDVSNSVISSEMANMRVFIENLIGQLKPFIDDGDVALGIAAFATYGDPFFCDSCDGGNPATIDIQTGDADNILDILQQSLIEQPYPGQRLEFNGNSTSLSAGYCAAHRMLQSWILSQPSRASLPKKILLLTDVGELLGSVFAFDPNQECFNQGVFDQIDIGPHPALGPVFDSLEADINQFDYESIVIGIDQSVPFNNTYSYLDQIHTDVSNGGNAFESIDFTSLLDSGFVEEVFLSLCTTSVPECPPGWMQEEDKCVFTEYEDYIVEDDVVPIDFDDDCLQECSWTAAYNPLFQTWIGHYDFIPNYYVSHTNYFQSGINNSGSEFGLWSHLLTKKSFQVFYGNRYPWIVEIPTKNAFLNKRKDSVSYWLDSKRFHNEFDFAQNRNAGFDHAVIYNHDENTGMLNLVRGEKNNLQQLQKYPIFNADTIDILATQEQRKWSFNYIFDVVKDKYNNIPIWLNDCPNVHKYLNNRALDYRPTLKNNLRGDWFLMRLYQESDSQHQYTFKWVTSKNDIYQR